MVATVTIFCIYYLCICVPHFYVCLRVCLCVFANTSVSDDSQDDDNHYEECSRQAEELLAVVQCRRHPFVLAHLVC